MHVKQPILLAWSGGKDAAWTLERLRSDPRWHVAALLCTFDPDRAISSRQGVALDVLRAQARAARLPLRLMPLATGASNNAYRAAFSDALESAQLLAPGLTDIAFGDVHLSDIRDWREQLCRSLGFTAHFPLFGSEPEALAREMIDGGLRGWLCQVDSRQLDPGFLGRDFDHDLLDALPAGVDRCGERGEFHTVVTHGPMFDEPLTVRRGERWVEDERFHLMATLLD
ncbi:ATP-binding protein [Pseudomarimonas salicorniae]|uniref:ATP-binding protein n=1 Tax=Pseudomarimonas salicorniae TaxID=2933270 RepID=A0ABT0GFW1_9GAMM|nr:ATP-binding protein [Lysobacter sp. CAU 1642]MCK7592932.1 ATP-binding protein [Lysobacter sp. CAU 1642]